MLEVLKCSVCGKVSMIIHDGSGEQTCCGKPMEFMAEKADDAGKEKHVPVIDKTQKGIKVTVGAIPHPMTPDHYIEWIEIASGNVLQVKGMQPGDLPEAEFGLSTTSVKARAYCNKHGLWSNKPRK